MDVNFNSSDFNRSDLINANTSANKMPVSEYEQTSFLSKNYQNTQELKKIDVFSKSFEELERDLRAFDFNGFEITSEKSFSKLLENEKKLLTQEQQEAIDKKDNTELNFFELAIRSIEKLTGKSVFSIQNN